MSERIHDDEPDISAPIVRALLAAECPQWARSPVAYVKASGTDNAMWRIRRDGEPDVVVRLPRRPHAAAGVLREAALLDRVGRSSIRSLVKTPTVRHVGGPHEAFPHHWSVLEWIDGTDAWTGRDAFESMRLDEVADHLARVVVAVGQLPTDDTEHRAPGHRGGPLGPLLERLDGWLDSPQWSAEELINVPAVRRLAAEALDVVDEPVNLGFVHGDLIPGNLLVDGNRLAAILDWGGAGQGDTAQDLAPAWAMLQEPQRQRFRQAVGADDAAWIRGRTFELEHAVGGVLYYRPRGHALGDVMARTLDRILASS